MNQPSFFSSLAGRLLMLGVVPAMLVIAAIVTWSAVDGYKNLKKAEEQTLAADASGAAAELSVRNDRWNNIAQVLASSQANGLFGRRVETHEFVRSVVASTNLIQSAYVVYEPNADGLDEASLKGSTVSDLPREAMDASGRFAPVWYRESGGEAGNEQMKLKPSIGMESMDYYLVPKNEFSKSGLIAATITAPFSRQGKQFVAHVYPIVIKGKFVGVAGVNRSLDTVASIVSSIKQRSGADVFLLDSAGEFIAATTDLEANQDANGRLRDRMITDTPYSAFKSQWMSVAAGGSVDVTEATDPVLKEPCFYAVERTTVGGWTVIVRRNKAAVMRDGDTSMVRNAVIGLGGMVLVGGLMFIVSRRISGRVRGAAEAADRIARGDLTKPVAQADSSDETGQLMSSMNSMDTNLNTLVGNVKQASIRLNSTATEIAATSKQQEAQSATFGAASNQIAAAVKEISATGRDLVKTMESVNQMADETANLASTGRSGLQGMEGVMRDLEGATASIAEKLNAISERSQKITTVITTITKVADQTNILSINAAIEAEKAGEFGAGFLVIAREIRRLADQTASATLDIEQMVQQMQGAVSSGVMEMDRFADQVRRGVREVASAGTQMTEIIDRVNRSTASFKQVNESTQAQTEGAQQISEAMGSLVGNANQTVQSAKEFSRAASDLQSAIALLREAVAQFKLRDSE